MTSLFSGSFNTGSKECTRTVTATMNSIAVIMWDVIPGMYDVAATV